MSDSPSSTPAVGEPSRRVAALERENALLRTIVNAAPVMLYQWVLSAAGEARFTFVSEGSRLIYDLTPEQLLADMRYSLEVVHPDDMAGFQRAVAASARDLTPFSWHGRIVLPSAGGRVKWLRAQSTPTREPDGSTRWEGVMVDITDQTEVARWMLDAHAALANARDLDAIFAAVVAVLSRAAPLSIDFSRVHADDGGAHEIEVVYVWQEGRTLTEYPMLGRRFPIRGSAFGEAILRAPRRAHYVPDIRLDPAAAAHVQDLPREVRSVAVLPLYSERHASWEGVIVVQWTHPHEPDEAERMLHALLIHATAEALASERARVRTEDLLHAQAAALAERSTPLIPVRDDVLVMPLIGTIDAERGRQILDVLVQLGGRSGVHTAILDLTGVRNLDTAAAAAILAAAAAVRLRGVRAVLTGIQPAAAHALAELGVDFSGVRVFASLQDAIDRASRR